MASSADDEDFRDCTPIVRMTHTEMQSILQEDGLPLFVYNKHFQLEPKRLQMHLAEKQISLTDNEMDEDLPEGSGDHLIYYFLEELQCVELGAQCSFATLLNAQQEESLDSLVVSMRETPDHNRLAAFRFKEGSLCMRFLSTMMRDAAVDVLLDVCPQVVKVGP